MNFFTTTFRSVLLITAACAAAGFSPHSQAALAPSHEMAKAVIQNIRAKFYLPGGGQVALRESPTQQSLGTTRIDELADGSYQISSFFDVFTEISLDDGNTWSPTSPETSPLQFQATASAPVPSPDGGMTFDTEMLSLSLDTVFPPIRIRESPSLQSRGIVITKPGSTGGTTRIEGFFDVFTELSMDGGQTWTPAASASQIQISAVPLPTTAWLLGSGLLGLAGVARRQVAARAGPKQPVKPAA